MDKTPSNTSPKGGRRGCLCPDNTYRIDCCDGSLQAQGIGNITGEVADYIVQEDGKWLYQENNYKIKK